MTVCIAAACSEGDDKRIVLCTDLRAGSALGSAETALKQRYISKTWRCLTAGSEPDINAMLKLYSNRFNVPANITYEAIDASIKEPLYERKRDLANEHTQTKFSLSYDEFIKVGKERLPPDLFRDAVQRIATIDLRTDLIMAGFIVGYPEIYHCDSKGRVSALDEFAVVGEGEYLATASLLRREQDYMATLERTLYNVFEAKKYSEAVGSVGRKTRINILHADGTCPSVSGDQMRKLEIAFEEYGPKKLPESFSL